MQGISDLVKMIHGVIRNYLVIWLVASLGMLFTIVAFSIIKEQINTQKAVEFTWVAHNRNRLLKHGLEGALEPVRVIRDHVQALGNVTSDQFGLVATPLLTRNPGIEMLGLILNTHSKNNNLEIQISNNYSTLTYVADRGNTRFRRGYTFASQQALKDTLQRAQNTGKMAVSRRIELTSKSRGKYGVMVSLPLYGEALDATTVKQADGKLVGFVVAILRLDELVHVAISYLEPRGVNLLILDDSVVEENRFLEFYASRLTSAVDFSEQQTQEWLANKSTKLTEVIQMADRKWSVTAIPNAKFRSAEAFAEGAWVVLVSGILLTALLSIYLLRVKLNLRERIRMSRQLKDKEELFWQMTETVDDIFWAITADKKRFLYVSPAFETIRGLSCEAVYNNMQLYCDTIHPDDNIRWFDALEQARVQQTRMEVIYRILRLDGTQRWIRDSIFPVLDRLGEVYRLVGVAEDITEKKQADDILRDSENELRTIFNQSPDTIMTVNSEGMILLINRWETLESLDRPSVGQHSAELLPPTYREDYKLLLSRSFQSGEISYLPYSADESTWWEIRIVPIVENGEVQASMVISTDVTEKRVLQTLAIRNERLASIGVLATGVAHDINNPNSAIQTGIGLFSNVWKDVMPVLREYYTEQGDFSLGGLSFAQEGDSLAALISEIKNNSHRIETIVGNLKHLGKNDPGNQNEEVNINAVLKAAVRVLESAISKHTHNWSMKLTENLPSVRGNVQQLEQVIINLILNALQSLPDLDHGVRVESAIDPGKKFLILRVIDQGSGIINEDISKVTEPFFTTRLKTGGIGLGLSISSTIVENHNGSIQFESSVGVGTSVTLKLPVAY